MIAWIDAQRAGLFARQYWLRNVIAGIIVGVVALPLSMAFAIATGVKPEQGIYTAIVAGIVVSVCGGSRVQIAGPTGAFIAILAGITATYGINGLQVATFFGGRHVAVDGLIPSRRDDSFYSDAGHSWLYRGYWCGHLGWAMVGLFWTAQSRRRTFL